MYGLNKVLQKRGDPQINCQKCNFPKIVQQKITEPLPCAGVMFHVLVVSQYDHSMIDLLELDQCSDDNPGPAPASSCRASPTLTQCSHVNYALAILSSSHRSTSGGPALTSLILPCLTQYSHLCLSRTG